MASAQKLSSGRWRGVYRDGNGNRKYVKGTFAREKQARDAATAAEVESRQLGWRDPSAAGSVWADWCMEWWATRSVEPTTARQDLVRLNRHVLPRWAEERLVDIKRGDVKAWAKELAATPNGREDDFGEPETLSASTVQKIVYLLSGSLAAAIDEGVLDYNPAARLKLPPAAQANERYLDHDEYAAVRAALPTDHDRLIADILSHTGVRWGELAGGHWARINQATGVWQIVDTWDAEAARMKAYPKGRRSRPVPFPLDLLEQLAELERDDRCGRKHQAGKCQSGLILSGARGAPLDAHNWGQRVWNPAVKKAKVGACRVHDLRHTFASWMIQSGMDIAELGALLGHISAQTTQRYAHLKETKHAKVAAGLPPKLGTVSLKRLARVVEFSTPGG